MSTECAPPEKLFRVYVALWLASFFSPLLYSGMNNVLPSIALEFSASAATISFIVILFAFSQGFFGTIGGRMSDLFGLRRMMSIGFIICAITLGGLCLSTNFAMLSVFRFAQGIGTALLISCSTAIAVNITPIYNRGTILGVITGAAYLGGSLGPLIAGSIATYLGWRLVFITLLIPCLGGLLLFRHSLKLEWCTIEGEKFDTKGAILLGLGIGCISLGAGLFSNHFALLALIPIGIILIGIFIYTQKTTKYPVINFSIFTKSKSFALGIFSMFINFGSVSSIVYFTTMYFQQVRGFTPIIAGTFLLFKTFPQFLFTPIAGRLADKMHPEYLVIVGITICTISLGAIAFLDINTDLYYIGFILFLAGTGVSIISAPCTLSALRDIQPKEIGLASGLTGTARSMGVLFTQIIASLAISNYLGTDMVDSKTVPLFLDSMHTTLFILVAFNVLCLLAYIRVTFVIIKEENEAELREKEAALQEQEATPLEQGATPPEKEK